MQTPDKKKQMFLDMQEHPEKYSEEQIETMMDDLDRLPDVDVAWQEFQQTGQSSPRRWLKAAASIIGVLMLSGIAYAAVHIISRNAGVDEETPTHEVQNINSPLNDDAIVETFTTDSIPQTRIFENTPLDEMVSEIAHYYNKVADIQSKEAHELRLYYKWDPKDALENVVDDLNHFDRVNLAIEDDKLIVKP
jgi:ferric-dicitrate binding protein FerR (iron transport regulator)